jgi:S1-C subfamily serine protease
VSTSADGRSLIASMREAGAGCPHCAAEVATGDPVVICRACGTVHHQPCWTERAGCGSYACAPARRPEIVANATEPVLLITEADLGRAIPLREAGLPHRAARPDARTWDPDVPGSKRPPARPATSRLAIASLICALAGIPLFGLVTGLVAVVLALCAMGGIRRHARRGAWLAASGFLLGILDVVVWGILLTMVLSNSSLTVDLLESEPPPDIESIQELPPPLQRAMRANVLIERKVGMSILGGKAIGSGVILRIDRGEALIVTNRHVIDPDHESSNKNPADRIARLGRLTVRMLGQPDGAGDVVWIAPGTIDLALVRASCSPSTGARDAPWQKGRPMKVGETVFAIGNPHQLGWTQTQGVISQFRNRPIDDRRIRVIQTQTPINHGNSGGGLYDQEGYCIGINTWTADKRETEGIGFAIVLDTLLDLAPPPLENPDKGPSRR